MGRRLLFVLRYLRDYRHSRRWLDFLATDLMVPIGQNNPGLYRKPIRPYVSIHWSQRTKIEALIFHYEFLARRLRPEFFRGIGSQEGMVLLTCDTKNNDQLRVRLHYDNKFRKEGEATLDLESAKYGCRVFSLTFVVAACVTGEPCLVIGAVSGLPANADKDIIKETAKALFGLRPKALLLLVVQQLAEKLKVKIILGVASRIHSSRHWVYAFNSSRRFAINYDDFWREVGGARRSDGMFVLPQTFPMKNLETIKSHKRSLYRQRYNLIDELRQQMKVNLRGWQPDSAETKAAERSPQLRLAWSKVPSCASLAIICCALILAKTGYADTDQFSIHGQTTVIEQWHDGFAAPYSGTNSLGPKREDKHTVTITLFLGYSLWRGGEIYYNPELTEGTGLSGTVGVAGFPNGEATRAGSSTPEYNTARLFVRQTFGLGGPQEKIESDSNQIAGVQDSRRLTLTLGKLSAADLFDTNAYSHDPRTQLLNWALMENGAWDFPADAKGYTGGFTADLKLGSRSVRWGIFMEPAEANGRPLDSHLAKAVGQAWEWEERYQSAGRPAALRALIFWNRAHMGSYDAALQSAGPKSPDVTLSRRYRSKAGAGLNWEQELADGLGAFARVGFNDGRNETWAFTEIDRTASAGLSLKGAAWSRPADTFTLAAVVNGLSAGHRNYLAAGGYGFIVGDGALRYGTEEILETNYDWKMTRWLALAPDVQLVAHPGYNRDRGPVAIFAFRLHAEF